MTREVREKFILEALVLVLKAGEGKKEFTQHCVVYH